MYSRSSGRNFTRLVPLPLSRVARAEQRRQTPEDDCCEQCAEDCDCTDSPCYYVLCTRYGRFAISVAAVMLIYLLFAALSALPQRVTSLGEQVQTAPRAGIDAQRARTLLNELCDAYEDGAISGDSCSRLCYKRNWEINDFYEGHKVVIVLKEGGQLAVLKSARASYDQFAPPDLKISQDEFSDKVVDLINQELKLGWPREFKRHLMETLWPTLLRIPGEALSKADRTSLWSLLQQPEFILFRVLPLTRVTPKLIGTCGHFYEPEALVAFKMKKYYMNLKGKILVHIMGTLKLLYEFLNEPLQWCDVSFENLGLSADYPKRFVLMDADNVYTQSKLTSLLKGKPCSTDADCTIGFDCRGFCLDTMTCSDRRNTNLEVFCDNLVKKIYGTTWSTNNRYLAACRDPALNSSQRLNDLRLTWSWNLPDV